MLYRCCDQEDRAIKESRRCLKGLCDGLLDQARTSQPRSIDDDQVAAVIERTLRTIPVDATQWSLHAMAAETGFSHTTIRRMWAAFGVLAATRSDRRCLVERSGFGV